MDLTEGIDKCTKINQNAIAANKDIIFSKDDILKTTEMLIFAP